MRRGSTVQVKIDKTEFPSVGVGELEGKKIYVRSLSRTNSFRKGKEKREDYAELKLSVDERAEYEIEPPCEHFGVCGGWHLKT